MPDYEYAPGTLRITKDLGWALDTELREHCRKLLDDGSPKLIIDLSEVNHVCSANLVAFAYLGAISQKSGKQLEMIVNPKVARTFEVAGFSEFAVLHVRG